MIKKCRTIYVWCLWCILMCFSLHHAAATKYTWTLANKSPTRSGKLLSGHVLMEYENIRIVTQCAQKCLQSTNCKSFNFLQDSRKCQLNTATHVQYPDDVTDSRHAQYYLRTAFSVDKVRLRSEQ